MINLRMLGNSQNNEFSLEQWIDIARSAGVNPDPDAEIDTAALNDLKWAAIKLRQNQQAQKAEQEKKKAADQAKKAAASVKQLEKLIEESYIFIDLTTLMNPSVDAAFRHILPMLKKKQKKIYILNSALSELRLTAQKGSDPERSKLADRRVTELQQLYLQGLLSVKDTKVPNISSVQDLFSACAQLRMRYSLLVITEDKKLAADLLKLNSQQSASGKAISVKRINKYGYLSNTLEKPKFTICTQVRSGKDSQIPVGSLPKANDHVYRSPDRQGRILLTEEIGSGGEGCIYRTDTPYVAKIYKKECCTAYRFEKIEKMIGAGLSCEGICFPVSILYNGEGQPTGYLMPEAKGFSIQSSIFKKPLFLKKLPGWKKEDLVQCAITILSKIEYLHKRNILIGDINPNNFLVVSPTEVYLVDTDSFQIDDLPCPVGFPLFTAPEIHMRHKKGEFNDYCDILRTRENEYFAVATLIFMLMMPGKPPYTQTGGENIVENILEMHFPYAVGQKHGQNVPDGTWRFIWSHLTRKMKENFLQVFDKSPGKSEFNIAERLSVEQWKNELSAYLNILRKWKNEIEENPLTTDCDPLSLELYPSKLKLPPGFVICRGEGCTNAYAKDDPRMKAGFCPECQKKGETLKCWYCGNQFTFTNFEKYYLGWDTAPLLCPDCRKTKDEVVYSKKCSSPNCSNKIVYKKGDTAYARFKADQKGYKFEYPKKCLECKNRGTGPKEDRKGTGTGTTGTGRSGGPSAAANKPGQASSGGSAPYRPNAGGSSSGKAGCFITTAVCGFLGKPDDCAELTAFRQYRDTWLAGQPGGRALIEEYYRIAPELVRKMQKSPLYETICRNLWENYLVPCHQMILDGKPEECRSRYMDMVHYLGSALEG